MPCGLSSNRAQGQRLSRRPRYLFYPICSFVLRFCVPENPVPRGEIVFRVVFRAASARPSRSRFLHELFGWDKEGKRSVTSPKAMLPFGPSLASKPGELSVCRPSTTNEAIDCSLGKRRKSACSANESSSFNREKRKLESSCFSHFSQSTECAQHDTTYGRNLLQTKRSTLARAFREA